MLAAKLPPQGAKDPIAHLDPQPRPQVQEKGIPETSGSENLEILSY